MIIWNGLGFLGALILVIAIVTANSIGEDLQGWAFLISAVPVWLLGRYFYKRPAKMMVDPKNQQNVLVKPEHTLFWVTLDYWAIIFGIFGIALLLPDSGFNTKIASVLMAIVYFGRLGYGLYDKYLKIDSSLENESTSSSVANDYKEDKLSRFSTKSKEKKKGNPVKSTLEERSQEQRIPESELKKKAFYAQMRKDREGPKKFAESNHQNYFPGNSMPFIPTKAILNKDTFFEEE